MLYTIEEIEAVFKPLEKLRGVAQNEKYHPEKDAFVHSLQVFLIGAKESTDIDLLLAGLLHDVGKSINTLGHDDYSVKILKGIISEKTEWLIQQHIRVKWLLSGEMKKVFKVNYLINHVWFKDLIHLNRWDLMGRNPSWIPSYDREQIIKILKRGE